ncbi:MAG TPA: hypothetical protein VMT95_10735 [Candidatus Binatia bacterium]|nr:hypothetical protein [Candidatus Binatia bacterium]
MSGVPAALWLLGLFAAAPALRDDQRYGFADRLRDALILGVAIPFALGLANLLYPVACWIVLAACLAVAYYRNAAWRPARLAQAPAPPYLLIGALVAVSWPQLMRPLLDGDSLSYHLPSAASWIQNHSLWATTARYWWYPPASELFASALYAVGGAFALPWCGFSALALLGFRVAAWAREDGAPPLLADALAACAVTAYPLAIQAGTLQNDVWLAAFWLETLWLLRAVRQPATAMPVAAATALIKPQGWLLTALALIASRAPVRVWLAAGGAVGLWLVHDALLWNRAVVAPASAVTGTLFGSTILAHGVPALALLDRVALAASPFAVVAFCAALLGPVVAEDRRVGWAALGSALLFFVLPFGYSTWVAQLATGASLRFAAPAVAAGAVILTRPARGLSGIASALLILSALYGVWIVFAIFWNDGLTRIALPVALLAVALAAAAHRRCVAWPYAVAFGVTVVATTYLGARHPLDYYADALRVGTTTPGIYRWIETHRPAALGGVGMRIGVVNVVSPETRTVDLSDDGACAQARRDDALLAAVADNDLPPAINAQRMRRARACGTVLYDDGIAVVAQP